MNTQWSTGSGVLLHRIRSTPGIARSTLVDELGWARATVGKRLEELIEHGYIQITGQHQSTGGRRAEAFALNAAKGVVLAADIGASHSRLAVSDLAGEVLIDDEADILIASGPDEFFEWAEQVFAFMLARVGRSKADVLAVGIGVPDPVDPTSGILRSPAARETWTRHPIAEYITAIYPNAVIAVERDANLLAIAERRGAWPHVQDLALVKFSSGIGSGFVIDGRLYHGSEGTAGCFGSLVRPAPGGQLTPIEEFASGWAIQEKLADYGYAVRTSADIVALARGGDAAARDLISAAARVLAEASVDIVRLINPAVLIVSGTFAETEDLVLAPFVETFERASATLACSVPEIALARIGRAAGVRGATLTALDKLFAPDRISALTARSSDERYA